MAKKPKKAAVPKAEKPKVEKVVPKAKSPARPVKKRWHVCDTCLLPLADELSAVLKTWRSADDTKRPDPVHLRVAIGHVDLPLAIVWLKVNVSVEFARDLENAVYGPLRDFEKLSSRVGQLEVGDIEGNLRVVSESRGQIHRFVSKCYEHHRNNGHVERDEWSDPALEEVEEAYSKIANDLRETVLYLKRAAAVLRAKINKRPVDPKDTPPPTLDVAADFERGTISVDGIEQAAEPNEIRFVQSLISNIGNYVSGSTMQEMPGCKKKRFDLIAKDVFEKIPAIRNYIEGPHGNKGWRALKK